MLQPRKRFGQHFLQDQQYITRIVRAIQPKPEDSVVEIGPGLGALTLPLLKCHSQLTAIELDRDLVPLLEKKCAPFGKLTLYQADALQFDFTQLVQSRSNKLLRIVGNLPYNISTPLLFHLLTQRDVIQDMHFMLQREVAERLAAQVDTPAYGRLSVMIQYDFDVALLFLVPPQAFQPPPKVDSAVIRLMPKMENQQERVKDRLLLASIVREAFQYKRKTLKNALASYFTEAMLLKLAIDPTCRPAECSINEYIRMANMIATKENNDV